MNFIKKVQQRLKELGFDAGPVDGIRGPKTDAAVTAYKVSVGLKARPFVGVQTVAKLFAETAHTGLLVPPRWLQVAETRLGLQELPGTGSNPEIMNWADDLDIQYSGDDVPWCGLFVASCLSEGLAPASVQLPEKPLVARGWLAFGQETSPRLGSLLVFWRGNPTGWQGHVGFYLGEDDTRYLVIGGNQQNSVSYTQIAKSRLLEARWPLGIDETTTPIQLVAIEGVLSTNEA